MNEYNRFRWMNLAKDWHDYPPFVWNGLIFTWADYQQGASRAAQYSLAGTRNGLGSDREESGGGSDNLRWIQDRLHDVGPPETDQAATRDHIRG